MNFLFLQALEIFPSLCFISNVSFESTIFYFSDNYLSTLDLSQYVTNIGNKARGIYSIDIIKSTEHKQDDCQQIADKAYRKANCLAQCMNDIAIETFNCTIAKLLLQTWL